MSAQDLFEKFEKREAGIWPVVLLSSLFVAITLAGLFTLVRIDEAIRVRSIFAPENTIDSSAAEVSKPNE